MNKAFIKSIAYLVVTVFLTQDIIWAEGSNTLAPRHDEKLFRKNIEKKWNPYKKKGGYAF